jgi:lysine decarboxylase
MADLILEARRLQELAGLSINEDDTDAALSQGLSALKDLEEVEGVEIEEDLQAAGIRVEMADRDTIVFLGTIADTKEDFDRLADVLIPILKRRQEQRRESATALSWSVTPQRSISMRDAYFAKTEMVLAAAALGRVCADLIAPYPPGVAVVAPGEVLTSQIIEGLASSRAAGVRIAYATDPTLAQYRVVLES